MLNLRLDVCYLCLKLFPRCYGSRYQSIGFIDQAKNRGMVTRGGNLGDEVHMVNSRALISKIDVIWGFLGAICLIFVFKVSFSCI